MHLGKITLSAASAKQRVNIEENMSSEFNFLHFGGLDLMDEGIVCFNKHIR